MAQQYADDAFLLLVAPGLAALDPATRAFWLEQTQAFVSLDEWGECAEMAHALRAAHCLTALPSPNSTGPNNVNGAGYGVVASKADGPASISYSTTTSAWSDADDQQLATTAWGRKYLELRATKQSKWGAALARSRSRWPGS